MAKFDGPRPQGHPCWMDLTVPDVEAAAAFYASVFGWDYAVSGPEFAHYHQAKVDGRGVAGLAQRTGDDAPPPAWTLFFAADDVDAMTFHANDLGGSVRAPVMEIPGQGRMAIVADPTGAAFGLWEPIAHHGFGVAYEPGGLAWCELVTADAHAATAFYRSLLGAEAQAVEGRGTYFALQKDGESMFGIAQRTDTGAPSRWSPYLMVEDADTAAATVRDEGGGVLDGPFDSEYGRIFEASDPFGATFKVLSRPKN
jgi:uncharacterized protein